MVKGNLYFDRLKRPYIFPIIEQKLADLKAERPDASPVNMGIGDVALPLAPAICQAIAQASQEMSTQAIYGYGPCEGYTFLREAIASNVYVNTGISAEEIFISDGINTDIVNILDLFDHSCSVAIPDPAYPAYLASNLLIGRTNIYKMPCTLEGDFTPVVPKERYDILYLCSPHNPTGVAMTKKRLTEFVEYALKHRSLLLIDSAYEAFVTSPDVPKSIYEIPGAEQVALEFRSFSKSAGFTGLRCSYLVLPKQVKALFGQEEKPLHSLWKTRQSIKFNGVAYPIQKGAEACFSVEGKKQTQNQVLFYLEQAKKLREGLAQIGHTCFGGIDSPFIWWKTPNKMNSWQFFDHLLQKCELIAIPGSGFGEHGEGYIRLSAFATEDKTKQALERIQKLV